MNLNEILDKLAHSQNDAETLALTQQYELIIKVLPQNEQDVFEAKLRAILLQRVANMYSNLAEAKDLINQLESKKKSTLSIKH